jgi:hypothetical protein
MLAGRGINDDKRFRPLEPDGVGGRTIEEVWRAGDDETLGVAGRVRDSGGCVDGVRTSVVCTTPWTTTRVPGGGKGLPCSRAVGVPAGDAGTDVSDGETLGVAN